MSNSQKEEASKNENITITEEEALRMLSYPLKLTSSEKEMLMQIIKDAQSKSSEKNNINKEDK